MVVGRTRKQICIYIDTATGARTHTHTMTQIQTYIIIYIYRYIYIVALLRFRASVSALHATGVIEKGGIRTSTYWHQ